MTVQQHTIDLGYRPRPIQRAIHQAMARHRFGVIVAHRRFGKTVFCIAALVDAALRFNKHSNGRFGYVAPFYKQAKDVAWLYLTDFARKIPGTQISNQELAVTFPNGNRIKLYGADNPDSMRGLYFDGIVVDEVADIKPHVWGEILRPALSDRKGWAIFIGTPKGVNIFSELYYNAVNDPDWFAGLYSVDDTGLLDADELRMIRATSTESQYAQEMLCDFNAAVDNALISLDSVQQSCGKHRKIEEVEGSPKILGVDVARYGDDRCCIFPRQGLIAFKPKTYKGIDNMTFAGYVSAAMQKWEPDAVFVDAGRGEGVIDRLRQLGHSNVIEVNFGGKASDPHYVNKRSEMWDNLKRWIDAGGCLPPIPELKIDLCAPTFSYANAANKFQLESKDKIKERGLPSPDLGDALALTFAMPVVKKATVGLQSTQRKQQQAYNPVRDRLKKRG
jgi:hypothetical protein